MSCQDRRREWICGVASTLQIIYGHAIIEDHDRRSDIPTRSNHGNGRVSLLERIGDRSSERSRKQAAVVPALGVTRPREAQASDAIVAHEWHL